MVGQWWHHDVDKGLAMLYRCAQARREEPTEGRASPDNAEGTESRKRRKPRSWLDTASPPPKEDAREPVAPGAMRQVDGIDGKAWWSEAPVARVDNWEA